MLDLDPFPTDYEEDIVELFGFQWVTETALVESCTLLFGLFRYDFYYFLITVFPDPNMLKTCVTGEYIDSVLQILLSLRYC